jgi:hypothetical protein
MEAGFVVDHTHAGVAKPEWASGEPQYSIWTGVRLGGRTRHRVITYRCTRCGFLEAYANPDASD